MSEKKVIIITGASKGIGKETAKFLSKVGHKVALVARSEEKLKVLEEEINTNGGRAFAIVGDVTKEDDVKNVVNSVLEKYGTIDVLINNAGIGYFKRVDQFTLDEVREVFDVNFIGVFLFTKYVTPTLIANKSGKIINVSSIAGLSTGFQAGTIYAASKYAVNGFTWSLREDLKEFGIAVSSVCPGSVRTTFGGLESKIREYTIEPMDVAKAIGYLVSESETVNTKLIEIKPRRREKFR